MPFFSIIIPSYNRAPQLVQTLHSLLVQSFEDFEIIVVDDGSTDNTQELMNDYCTNYSFIKYQKQKNNGVCAARNNGAKIAKGDYLIFLDSDDLVEISWLKDFYQGILKEKSLIIYCSLKVIHANGKIIAKNANDPYKNGKNKGFVFSGSWSIEKEFFFQIGMYDENLKFGENNELRIRIDMMKPKMSIVNQYNFIYNSSSDGGSKNNQNKIDSILYTLDKHYLYFEKSKKQKIIQLNSAAHTAIKLRMYKKAHELFKRSLIENKTNLKLWLRYMMSSNVFLIKLIWK